MASAVAPETEHETEFPEFPAFAAVALELEFPIEFLGLSSFLVFSWVSWIGGWMDSTRRHTKYLHGNLCINTN